MTPPSEASSLELVVRAPRILSLCAGVGGIDLGIKIATSHAARTVCYVERDAYCAEVLAARMGEGLDEAPIWDCIKSFDGIPWRGVVDCIIGGYPCQPWSLSGKRLGKDDPRHLWPHIARIISEIRPAACFFENVPGHLTLGFEQVCEDLQRMGYFTKASLHSAAECGAPHQRQRLFFFAFAEGHGFKSQRLASKREKKSNTLGSTCTDMADTDSVRRIKGRARPILHERRVRTDGGCSALAEAVAHADMPGIPQRQSIGSHNVQECETPQRDGDAGVSAHGRPAFGGLDRVADGLSQGLDFNFWPPDWEDSTPRVAVGQEHRIDRLRALGNAVVPATAALAWRTLTTQAIKAACVPATK